ncbi:2'-deoxymugineic-acid 2'-dioxygenase, partial [Ananas comosus]
VVNHGISKSVMMGALVAGSSFFELPLEEKAEIASEDVKRPVRYEGAQHDGDSNSRLLLKHYAHPLSEWIHFWPRNPPEYRERMGNYVMEVRGVALHLLNAILESLGLSNTYIRDKLKEGMQLVAVNCYPCQQSQPDSAVGLAPHTDYGLISIVLQSSDGLQIAAGADGEPWKAIPANFETLHVHVGDHLEVLSNGRYRSLLHQAVPGPEKRTSIASIHGLAMDEKVTTPEALMDEQHPKKYRESSFRDFLDYISITHNVGGRNFIESLKIIQD